MKKRDVFVQILHEISSKPKNEIEQDMASMLPAMPGMDKEISDTEYELLLSGLREEKESIAKWGITGLQRLLLRNTPPKGNA